jgi:cytochrome c-type biogenesis protein
MEAHMEATSLIIPAFIAGLLTFLAPCTLPLVPGYLAFISGTSLKDLRDGHRADAARRRIVLNGLFFVLGFSLVFILLGVAAGLAGLALGGYRPWLSRIGGVAVIVFGLFMLEAVKLPFLHHVRRIKTPALLRPGRASNSFLLGAVFGLGWTPCIGPILGSILFLVSSSATAGQGAFLLALFSLGLGIPFIAVALSIGSVSPYIHRMARFGHVVSLVGGVFLVFLGVLLLTGNFEFFSSAVYRWFDFIRYDRLLDYL